MAKRGRPKASEEAARRKAVINAAFEELVERGYEKTTMLGIAKRASASKETLYAWFGNKEGLFAALIKHQADATVKRLNQAFDSKENPREALTNFAVGFLKLLLGEPSISLNRAAMSSPELATVLLQYGRYTAGPIVETYLGHLAAHDYIRISSPSIAFQFLYGLIIQDLQIRVLLGEEAPKHKVLVKHAEHAVDSFFQLYSK